MSTTQTVFVVDDHQEFREAMVEYLKAAGLKVKSFASAQEFLGDYEPSSPGCLILDVQMPEMSGFELQERLCRLGATIPIIIVTGNVVLREVVETLKRGAFDYLEKPCLPDFLLERVQAALRHDLEQRQDNAHKGGIRALFQKLTQREIDILALVIGGNTSKAIASQMGVAVSTIDNHRANIMKKLGAKTSADLTRIAILAAPELAKPRKE